MGFSCLRFLSRLFRAGLGIVPFRRTLRHLRPYTFKQASWPVALSPSLAAMRFPLSGGTPARPRNAVYEKFAGNRPVPQAGDYAAVKGARSRQPPLDYAARVAGY